MGFRFCELPEGPRVSALPLGAAVASQGCGRLPLVVIPNGRYAEIRESSANGGCWAERYHSVRTAAFNPPETLGSLESHSEFKKETVDRVGTVDRQAAFL